MKISYDCLEEIACDFYQYLPVLSDFNCFSYDDGSYFVEVNECGKTPKRLKITVTVEEMKELLLQIKQRTEKLLEETQKLEDLEFQYHTMCTITDYVIIQDQKDFIEFLKLKLKTSVDLLGEV